MITRFAGYATANVVAHAMLLRLRFEVFQSFDGLLRKIILHYYISSRPPSFSLKFDDDDDLTSQ